MAMDFWKSLAGRASARSLRAPHLSKEEEARLEAVLKSAEGNPFAAVAEDYVTGVREGRYQCRLNVDDIACAADSMVAGLFAANLLALGQKTLPTERQVMFLYEPSGGPGSGQPGLIQDLSMGERGDDEAEAILLGTATQWGDKLHHKLRAVGLVLFRLDKGAGTLEGEVAVHYGLKTDDGIVSINKIVQPVSYREGTFANLPRHDVGDPDNNTSRLIRAVFAINVATASIHPTICRRAE
jgi:hypothetical protein